MEHKYSFKGGTHKDRTLAYMKSLIDNGSTFSYVYEDSLFSVITDSTIKPECNIIHQIRCDCQDSEVLIYCLWCNTPIIKHNKRELFGCNKALEK